MYGSKLKHSLEGVAVMEIYNALSRTMLPGTLHNSVNNTAEGRYSLEEYSAL
jgi:hypothetical protein